MSVNKRSAYVVIFNFTTLYETLQDNFRLRVLHYLFYK